MDNETQEKIEAVCNDVCGSLLILLIAKRVLRADEIDAVFKSSSNVCKQNIGELGDKETLYRMIDEAHEKFKHSIHTIELDES